MVQSKQQEQKVKAMDDLEELSELEKLLIQADKLSDDEKRRFLTEYETEKPKGK
jgi:hypothetical protein